MMRRLFIYIFVFAAFATCPMPVLSQSDFSGVSGVELITKETPQPYSDTEVFLYASSLSTQNATINWYFDGVLQNQYKNTRSVPVTTRDINDPVEVSVLIERSGEKPLATSLSLIPVVVDMVIEADTITPTFYKGRPLPTSGSVVRVTAIPLTQENPKYLSYRWELDRTPLDGGAVVGKQSAEIRISEFKNNYLQLQVFNQEGLVIFKKTIAIPFTNPEVYFYEANPLTGMSRKAISTDYSLPPNGEMTVRAEPYHVNSDILNKDHILEWRINQTLVESDNAEPQNLTLRKGAETGTAMISFFIRSKNYVEQMAKETFTLFF